MTETRKTRGLKRLLGRSHDDEMTALSPDVDDAAGAGSDDRPEAPLFIAQSCELVEFGDESALLRVAGRWPAGDPFAVELFVAYGEVGELIDPLPPGPGIAEDGIWSAAFIFRREWEGCRCALTASGGGAALLPPPARATPQVTDAPARETELAPEPAAALPQQAAVAPAAVAVDASGESEAERLARALEDLSEAKALADQYRRRCELSERALQDFRDKLVQAWGESASIRELLDEREAAHEQAKLRAREADAAIAAAEQRAVESRRELDERRAEMEQQCARLEAELAQHAGASELAAELRAEAADALERFNAARADAERLSNEVEAARRSAEEAAAVVVRSGQDVEAERARADEAAQRADSAGERLQAVEAALAAAHEQIEAAGVRIAELENDARQAGEQLAAERASAAEAVERAQAERARAEAEARSRAEQGSGRGRRGSKVSSREHREVLAKLQAEQDHGARLELEVGTLASQLRALEQEAGAQAERLAEAERNAGATPAHETLIADLRHLVALRERELEEARAELNEQRARYSTVAGQAPPSEPFAERLKAEPAAAPWSAMDEDLLDRITLAKNLSGQD